jgi:hypothetical protein
MEANNRKFYLPENIKGILNSLCARYSSKGLDILQEIIMNSDFKILENRASEHANYPRYGHTLQLIMSKYLYERIEVGKLELQETIKNDINNIYVSDEFIAEVFLTKADESESEQSEVARKLNYNNNFFSSLGSNRIWEPECFKVFLSHKNEAKKEAHILKTKLRVYGISSFVAHEDIEPTREWQTEIELALNSMDCLVALLTDKFHDSPWTDQEVGFALGRGVQVIPVRLGTDPYGFIGKLQAVVCTWQSAANSIARVLVKNKLMFDPYLHATKNCSNIEDGDYLAGLLAEIEITDQAKINELTLAFNQYTKARNTFHSPSLKPGIFEENVAKQLNRLNANARMQ